MPSAVISASVVAPARQTSRSAAAYGDADVVEERLRDEARGAGGYLLPIALVVRVRSARSPEDPWSHALRSRAERASAS